MKRGKRYTAEQLDFLRAGYAVMAVRDLCPAFNARFGTGKTCDQIRSALKNHGITCGRKPGERKMPCRLYTPEQVQFLRENYRGRSVAELAALYNDHFGENKTQRQIKAAVKNRGIVSGCSCRFEAGSTPWNKGKKGYMGANATSFKKGNLPHNHQPLWSERIGKDGYIEMSVPERNPYTGFPTRYKHKHVWIWEQANGKRPRGTAVIFKDGNIRNFDLDNLLLVTRAELLAMNLHDYKNQPEELKPSVLALARMEAKAGIRTRPARGRRAVGG